MRQWIIGNDKGEENSCQKSEIGTENRKQPPALRAVGPEGNRYRNQKSDNRNITMQDYISNKKTIKSYRDLIVYQNLYKAQIRVLTQVIPNLPKEEKYDLGDQMRRACKAPPALLAEGFAKRYQKRSWQKYLDDCIGECYEMINHLSVCIDAYSQYVDTKLCKELIESYDISSAQLYKLKQSWKDFHKND